MKLESMSRGRTWTSRDRLEIRKPTLTSLGIDPGKALLGIGYNLPNEPSQAADLGLGAHRNIHALFFP